MSRHLTYSYFLLAAFALLPQVAAGDPIPYDLDKGDQVAYALRIEIQMPDGVDYLGGVAYFRGSMNDGRSLRATALDNLRRAKTAAGLPFAFPTGNHWLEHDFTIPEYGRPLMRVKGELPVLLGNLDALFFPPLPLRGDSREVRRKVHDLGGGDFRPIGTPSNVSKNDLGEFVWSTHLIGHSRNTRRYHQTRWLHTHSGRYQLSAKGTITVSLATRRMFSNELRGKFVFDGQPGEFTVQIRQVDTRQLRRMVADGN